MATEHYFSSQPSGEAKLRTVRVTLAGQERELSTANGVFSPERVDAGTGVLLANSPTSSAAGDVLDLGCGWGPVALTLALESPHATVWAVDVNERALDLVRSNADKLSITSIKPRLPDNVPENVRFSTIWSNPPIRVGKRELHALLQRWLPRLDEGGEAWLVVQRNLGSDSLHRWLESEFADQFTTTRAATAKGYRVLRVEHR